MDFRKEISDALKKQRPNLADSSLKTYVSMLYNLHKKLNGNEKLEWFNDNEDEVMKESENKPLATKKTLLSALFVLTGKESYNKSMILYCKESHKITSENKKNENKKKDGCH